MTQTRITADRIVVATGARPMVPPVIADSGVEFQTSDTIMRIDELPASMVIVGGGYVAAEFAHVFSSLGVDFTWSIMAPRLLESLRPRDLRALHRPGPAALGRPPVRQGHRRARPDGAASPCVLDGRHDGDRRPAAGGPGRQPNTDDLGLDLAGVKLRDDGRIQVDEYGRTTAEGIWSLGDASSPFELKHVANAEARTRGPQPRPPGRPAPVPARLGALGRVHRAADRLGRRAPARTWRARGPTCRPSRPTGDTAYGWALQDTGGDLHAVRRSGDRQAPRRPHPRLSGRAADPAAGAGHFVRAERGRAWPGASTGSIPRSAEVVENALLKLPLDARRPRPAGSSLRGGRAASRQPTHRTPPAVNPWTLPARAPILVPCRP